jgi:hypothetical protein
MSGAVQKTIVENIADKHVGDSVGAVGLGCFHIALFLLLSNVVPGNSHCRHRSSNVDRYNYVGE